VYASYFTHQYFILITFERKHVFFCQIIFNIRQGLAGERRTVVNSART